MYQSKTTLNSFLVVVAISLSVSAAYAEEYTCGGKTNGVHVVFDAKVVEKAKANPTVAVSPGVPVCGDIGFNAKDLVPADVKSKVRDAAFTFVCTSKDLQAQLALNNVVEGTCSLPQGQPVSWRIRPKPPA